jgi:CubicO group peptidase (beta-lactamase class C family)
MPTEAELQEKMAEVATRLDVTGAAVGVAIGPETHVAFHGVTNLDEPLHVDAGTLFQIGSTGKTYTTTALMQLVEQGRVELDAKVRTYIPELRLEDEQVARDVTVLHLLNHTAGW